MEPLVSICLPIKNGLSKENDHYIKLPEVLNCIFKQTYKNIEVIISDNCSTDKTNNYLESYLINKKNVKYFKQENEISWAENFKFVLSKASGKYIKWIACDDIISEDYIFQNVKFLEDNDDYIFSSSKFFFDKNQKNIIKNNLDGSLGERIIGFFKICKVSHNLFYGLIKKKTLNNVTDISKDYLAIDWIINLELLFQGKFKTLDDGHMMFGTNGMSMQKNYIDRKEFNKKFIYKLIPFYQLTKKLFLKVFQSSEITILQKLKIIKICLLLNIKHILKYKIKII